jgi:hypothetical protein
MSMDISLFQKPAPPPPAPPKPILGWILQAGRSSAPVYWSGDNAIDAWSGDHSQAIRFYRQKDAQKIQSMMGLYLGAVVPYQWDEIADRPTTKDYTVVVVPE